MSKNPEKNDELDFESLQEGLKENFGTGASEDRSGMVTDERLKEMNKKLPSWSLEPPLKFLK